MAIKTTNHQVAIKTINLNKIGNRYYIIAQEIMTMKRIDHPNIVKLYEIYRDDNKLYLVMEYVHGMELFDYIFENRMKESEAAEIIKQLVQCVNYLNSKRICHRDLKLENMVINPETFQIKVLDFGFSCFYTPSVSMKTRVGTPYYIAPEVLVGEYGPE